MNPIEFETFVTQSIVLEGECEIYPAERERAYLSVDGKMAPVGRHRWELANRRLPQNVYIRHTCNNSRCVKLEHLTPGTPRENAEDTYACGNKTSRTGVFGIAFQSKRGRYQVAPRINGRKVVLYVGKDFFEACCALKSWEAKRP